MKKLLDKLFGKQIQYTLIVVFIIIIALLVMHITIEHKAKGKPRCYICQAVLWHQDDQWQSYDIWACKPHWESAKYQAKHNLGIPQNEMNPDMPKEIYKVLTGRYYDKNRSEIMKNIKWMG